MQTGDYEIRSGFKTRQEVSTPRPETPGTHRFGIFCIDVAPNGAQGEGNRLNTREWDRAALVFKRLPSPSVGRLAAHDVDVVVLG